jgi:hypothetical protein
VQCGERQGAWASLSRAAPGTQHTPRHPTVTCRRKQDNDIHAAVLTLGLKFADWLIVGGNQRTTALLKALCQVIMDHQSADMLTSADLSRNLDARLKPLISFIVACRPLSIGMGNAIRSCSCLAASPLFTLTCFASVHL